MTRPPGRGSGLAWPEMPGRARSLACAVVAGLALAAPGGASAAPDPLAELKSGCQDRRSFDPSPVPYRMCSGRIESFDGTPLDATLTLPPGASGRPLPLIVFLHGLLNHKGEQISATGEGTGLDRGGEAYKTVEWNNVWFASRGYAVLNYSARGHGDSGGEINLASRDIEVRDARHLTGVLADDAASSSPVLRLDGKVAALGGSYGGGQTWLLLTTRDDPSLPYGQWRSPGGRMLRLAAAVPQYTWSDMLYSLVPNGRGDSRGPIGVGKQTLINGFLATAGPRLPSEAIVWLTRMNAGEPYDNPADPVVPDARRALTRDRSAFYQEGYFAALRDGGQPAVPVLAGQGWTDPIFPPVEALRMYRRLRQARPDYPIQLYLGDFEHLSALVKIPDLRHLHRLGNRLLDHYLLGRGARPELDVQSAVSNCHRERFGPVLSASDWDSLAPRRVVFELGGPRQTTHRTVDPRGATTDPVVVSTSRGRGCITTTAPVAPGVAAYSRDLTSSFTMAGLPRLSLRFRTAAPDVELNSRLWDVAPDGTNTLVTRGAYRAVNPDRGGERVAYELFGNSWRFESGHRILLEVTQDDSTYLRPDNVPSTVTIEDARLELPATAQGSRGQAERSDPPVADPPRSARRDEPPADPRPASESRSGEGTGGGLPFTGFSVVWALLAGAALAALGMLLLRLRA